MLVPPKDGTERSGVAFSVSTPAGMTWLEGGLLFTYHLAKLSIDRHAMLLRDSLASDFDLEAQDKV